MNRFATTIICLAVAGSLHAATRDTAASPLSQTRLAKAEKNYSACLASDNTGLVESALAMVARMRILCPARNCEEMWGQLTDLAMNGTTPSIRYRAYLVTLLMDRRTPLPAYDEIAMLDNNELFSLLAGRLQTSLLGISAR